MGVDQRQQRHAGHSGAEDELCEQQEVMLAGQTRAAQSEANKHRGTSQATRQGDALRRGGTATGHRTAGQPSGTPRRQTENHGDDQQPAGGDRHRADGAGSPGAGRPVAPAGASGLLPGGFSGASARVARYFGAPGPWNCKGMTDGDAGDKPLGTFFVPPRVFFEPYSLRYLRNYHGMERVLIVSDHRLYGLGYVMQCMTLLKGRHPSPEVEVFLDVTTTPSISTVYSALEIVESFQPDTLLALGGRTVIDVAKMILYMYRTGQRTFSFDQAFMSLSPSGVDGKGQLICVPTTSGSGSEVTPFAVIADEQGVKHTLGDRSFLPEVAIVDHILTRTLPCEIKAESGMDALANAVEAYLSLRSSSYSDGFVVRAVRLLLDNLAASVGGDDHALEQAHNAATIAGMAVGNAMSGLGHALANAIESCVRVDHGKCIAVLLPAIIRLNGASPDHDGFAGRKCAELVAKLGYAAGDVAAHEFLAQKVEALVKELKMATRFQAFVKEAEWREAVAKIAELALKDPSGNENPTRPTPEALAEFLLRLY